MPLMSKQNANPARPPVAATTHDAVDELTAVLADGDAAARRSAARTLGGGPGPIVPRAVSALLGALSGEGDAAVRSAILDALAALAARGAEDAVSGLADCLRSEDAALRNAAIGLLRGLPDQVAGVIAHLLVDADRDVRILTVGILDSLRHERAEEWLLQLIGADTDVNVCGAALDVLAEIATAAARVPVETLLARFPHEPYVEFASRLVLGRISPGDGPARCPNQGAA